MSKKTNFTHLTQTIIEQEIPKHTTEYALAAALKVNHWMLKAVFKQFNLPMVKYSRIKILPGLTKEKLIELSNTYTNVLTMAKSIETTRHTLVNEFKRFGLEVPMNTEFSTSNYNFFSDINEKSMYWAGFLAADGCLHRNQISLKLKLSSKDHCHIEQFKKDIESTKKIYHSTANSHNYSTIIISSQKMYDDLRRFGLTVNKTKTLTLPDWLVEHQLFRHFVRGMIDGDGCIGLRKIKNRVMGVGIHLCGASPAVKQVYDQIIKSCGFKKKNLYRTDISKSGTPLHSFCFRDLLEVEKLIKYLYEDATVYLKRKKDIADQLPQIKANSRNYYFDPIELQQKYDQLGSFKAVAKYYNCRPGLIRYQMLKLNLKTHSNSINFDRDILIQQYKNLKNMPKIAKLYGCSYGQIRNALIRFGVDTSGKSKP